MANGYGTSEPSSGKTGARIDALTEVTHELLALEDRDAEKILGLATLLMKALS